jgi:MoaA/NifB/PqqE/SkfB family radical SAM enzyme
VSLSNNIQLAKKLTFKKLNNAFKVWISYHLSKQTKRAANFGFPISIAIEPTTSCNLRCPECPSGLRQFTRPIGMLEPTFFKTTIDAIYKELIYLTFYFQGEPYLNPNFLEMVKYASDKKFIHQHQLMHIT